MRLVGKRDMDTSQKNNEQEAEEYPTISDSTPSELAIRTRLSHPYYKRHPYQMPPHLQLLEKQIMEALGIWESEGPKHLCVSMPPRHGKSEYISHYLPIWFACRRPHQRIIIVGYSQSFTSGFGRRIQSFFLDFSEMMNGLAIQKNSNSRQEIRLNNESSIICVGAGGPLTGRGADLIVIDDPIKSNAQSSSPNFRDSLDDWFRSTAFTRLEPGGSCIIVMTRWHEDDIIGRLAKDKERSSQFRIISIPALAMESDPLGRDIGEALWPERFSHKHLEEIRKNNGSHWFAAMYQQQPLPEKNAVFKISDFGSYIQDRDNYSLSIKEMKKSISRSKLRINITCDLAVAGSPDSDSSVFMVSAISDSSEILILHCEIFQGGSLENERRLLSLWERYRPIRIGIESVAYQLEFCQRMRAKGLPVTELKPTLNKRDRALRMQPYVEGGSVFLPREADWLDKFILELSRFPSGRHDDIVDAFSYIYDMLHSKSYFPTSREKAKSEFQEFN